MRFAYLALLLSALTTVSTASDWLTLPSTYSHDAATGQRVSQFAEIENPSTTAVPNFRTSGYTHTRSNLNFRGSFDNYHRVEEWGAPVRPYGEWQRPFRPYSVPYQLWGEPFAGLNNNFFRGGPGFRGGWNRGRGGMPGGPGGPGNGGPGRGGPGNGRPGNGGPGNGGPGNGGPGNGGPGNGGPGN